MPINEALRPFLVEMRGLSTDSQGREVLVGLTFEETEEYSPMWLTRTIPERRTMRDDKPDTSTCMTSTKRRGWPS